jgi:hypothetical protein
MSTIRAVLLDADGVVQLPGSAWNASLDLLCGDPSRADEFRTDVFAAEKPCLTGAADLEAALTRDEEVEVERFSRAGATVPA